MTNSEKSEGDNFGSLSLEEMVAEVRRDPIIAARIDKMKEMDSTPQIGRDDPNGQAWGAYGMTYIQLVYNAEPVHWMNYGSVEGGFDRWRVLSYQDDA